MPSCILYLVSVLNAKCLSIRDVCFSVRDVDAFANSLRDTVVSTLDGQAPWRTFTFGKHRAPWLSYDLKRRMRHCDSLFSSWV